MRPPSTSPRVLVLLTELNRRGIRGRLAKLFVRKYAQQRVARQIDYYDHEVVFRARLPHWAAAPWLAHRIRHDVPPPADFLRSSGAMAEQLSAVAYLAHPGESRKT